MERKIDAQASQTITLNKIGITNINSRFRFIKSNHIPLPDNGTYCSYYRRCAATGLTLVGPEDDNITQVGKTYTIQGSFSDTGTEIGTFTTISEDGCNEASLTATITIINAPVVITHSNSYPYSN